METIHVYTDESHLSDRYTLIGGIWVPAADEPALRASISAFRTEHSMARELKWTKVSTAKLGSYCSFVDVFLGHGKARFNCIVVDTSKVNHRQYSNGDSELGFYKFYYQLLSRKLRPNTEYRVHVDHRNDSVGTRLIDLERCVNAWWCRSRQTAHSPVRTVRAADSKKEDIIQLADVMLGAIGYSWNQHKGSAAKLGVVDHMERKLRMKLARGCAPGVNPVNIWDWQPASRCVETKKGTALAPKSVP